MRLLLSILLLTTSHFTVAHNVVIKDETETMTTIDMQTFQVPYLDDAIIDEQNLNQLITTLQTKVLKMPINAYIDETGSVIEGVPGVQLDKQKFRTLFYEYFYQEKTGELQFPLQTVHPKVTAELLVEIYDENINQFQTFYTESSKERSHNIKLSTEAIDNQVVFPGESFSFNKIVGERTIERGYQKATVIVKGEFSEDIGGGICQVSSTLFNAVTMNGIQMMERYSHSRAVPYVPPGKDAAVSWWGPDFVFKNNNAYPILIKAKANNGVLEIKLYARSNEDSKTNK